VEDGPTEEVVQIAPDGSTSVLSGPWAPSRGKVPRLLGVTE
jgi:hypothetical protein